jgi:hypothetical protein
MPEKKYDFSIRQNEYGQNPPFILMINYDLMLSENCFFMRIGMLSSLDIRCSIIISSLALEITPDSAVKAQNLWACGGFI